MATATELAGHNSNRIAGAVAANQFLLACSSDRAYAAKVLAAGKKRDRTSLLELIALRSGVEVERITIVDLDPDFYIQIVWFDVVLLCIDTVGDRCS
jgi:hypothetical protein